MNPYLKQKAAPWVSAAVLVGGLATALILVLLVRVERKAGELTGATDFLVENLSSPSHASPRE